MQDAVFSPRIVGTLRPDFHSLETVLSAPIFAGKSGEELALAIYDYFSSSVDGVWHHWPMNEQDGHPISSGDIDDPVKMLNAYGWTICGQNAGMLQGLYRAAGMPSRIRSVPGHTLCEVFYAERWHVLDVDMWTWFRTPAGHLASIEELIQSPRPLILENRQRSNPCNLPDRSLEDYAVMYEQASAGAAIFPFWASRAHTMDFALRPGETLIRSQTHAGSFHMPLSWKAMLNGPFRHEWQGIPRERFAPFRTVGNGRWRYAPNLAAPSRDVAIGAWSRDGLTQDASGMVGPGSITFRIQSPYPFCGIPDPQQSGFPTTDGVRLSICGSGLVTVEMMDAEGGYARVIVTRSDFSVQQDVTMLMRSRYGTMIRLTLADGARLTSFSFDGSLMIAPMSLPRLVEGVNNMELRCLDAHRRCTTPWTVPVDFRTEVSLRQALVRIESGNLEPGSRKRIAILPPANGTARAVFRFAAPESRRFSWAYVIATVPEGPVGAPTRRASLEWSVDGNTWTRCADITIPNTPLQWDGSIDGEFVLPKAVPVLWIRVTSDTGVIELVLAGHLEELPMPSELHITHRWTEGTAQKVFTVPVGESSYQIFCGIEPAGHTIEMQALST